MNHPQLRAINLLLLSLLQYRKYLCASRKWILAAFPSALVFKVVSLCLRGSWGSVWGRGWVEHCFLKEYSLLLAGLQPSPLPFLLPLCSGLMWPQSTSHLALGLGWDLLGVLAGACPQERSSERGCKTDEVLCRKSVALNLARGSGFPLAAFQEVCSLDACRTLGLIPGGVWCGKLLWCSGMS